MSEPQVSDLLQDLLEVVDRDARWTTFNNLLDLALLSEPAVVFLVLDQT